MTCFLLRFDIAHFLHLKTEIYLSGENEKLGTHVGVHFFQEATWLSIDTNIFLRLK